MAPVTVTIYKQSRNERLGIGLIGASHAPVTVSSIAEDGAFASSILTVGMEVLSINDIPLNGMSSADAIQILKDAEGRVVVVAEEHHNNIVASSAVPVVQAVQASSSSSSSSVFPYATAPPPAVAAAFVTTSTSSGVQVHPRKKRGYIIMKKTFKYKPSGFQMATEKSYSFHGPMAPDMVEHVNENLRKLRLSHNANRLQFKMNDAGHFLGHMNHAAQKYHEEDFVVVILEAMEELGYYFRFQYDAESFSTKMSGDSYTAKELFIFHKMQD